MSLIFMMTVLENQLKMSWNALEIPGIWKKILSGHHVLIDKPEPKNCQNSAEWCKNSLDSTGTKTQKCF